MLATVPPSATPSANKNVPQASNDGTREAVGTSFTQMLNLEMSNKATTPVPSAPIHPATNTSNSVANSAYNSTNNVTENSGNKTTGSSAGNSPNSSANNSADTANAAKSGNNTNATNTSGSVSNKNTNKSSVKSSTKNTSEDTSTSASTLPGTSVATTLLQVGSTSTSSGNDTSGNVSAQSAATQDNSVSANVLGQAILTNFTPVTGTAVTTNSANTTATASPNINLTGQINASVKETLNADTNSVAASTSDPGSATSFATALQAETDHASLSKNTAVTSQVNSSISSPAEKARLLTNATTQTTTNTLATSANAAISTMLASPTTPLETIKSANQNLSDSQFAAIAPVLMSPASSSNADLDSAINTITPTVGSPDWSQAVGQKISWMVNGGQQSASLTLNPPDLGPLQVVISVHNQLASATFTSHQPEVRAALESAIPKLREMMGQSGIELGNCNVNSQSKQQEFAQRQTSSAKNGVTINGVAGAMVLLPDAARSGATGVGLVDTFV